MMKKTMLIMVLILMASASGLKDDSLQLWWTFNDGTLRDYSGNGNHGLEGNYNFSQGKYGLGLTNIPNRYKVDVVNLSKIIEPNSWTVTLWFNLSEPFFVRPLLDFGNQVQLSFDRTGMDDYYQIILADFSCIVAEDTDVNLIFSGWHYMAISYNGTNMISAFDSSFKFSKCKPLNNPFSDSGNLLFSGGNYAQIDELKIFDRALTQREIQAEFKNLKCNKWGKCNLNRRSLVRIGNWNKSPPWRTIKTRG